MTAAFMKLRARLPDYEHIHSKKQIVDQVGSSQNYKELDNSLRNVISGPELHQAIVSFDQHRQLLTQMKCLLTSQSKN